MSTELHLRKWDAHELVGSSPESRAVMRLVEKLRESKWSVLIWGETGTGKEVVARAIHGSSRTPFVTIDCSSLVGPLIESALFGHVKGAFTGAAASAPGLLEMANGGTAFLDEIGDLPLDLQSKLLRALQEKEFRPVGSLSISRSDFRIIAASNRDLAAEVEKGTFRRDLYYRLNVISLRLAPLRERKEDIPELIDLFLNRLDGGYSLTAEVMEVLQSYDWPGNVRELENCIQYMVATSSERLLRLENLPSHVQGQLIEKKGQNLVAAVGGPSQSPDLPRFENVEELPGVDKQSPVIPLSEIERRAIAGALQYARGDRSLAAHMLGIGRTTLYRKLKEYHLVD